MRLKSHIRDPQLKVPPGGLVLRISSGRKNPEQNSLDPEAITLPRDHRGRHMYQ